MFVDDFKIYSNTYLNSRRNVLKKDSWKSKGENDI